MNIVSAIAAASLAFGTCVPPVLPYTELTPEKIEATAKNIALGTCTDTDAKVYLQLTHVHWKHEQMREIFYIIARESDDKTINAKDLGKMFDHISSQIDAKREKELQEHWKKVREKMEKEQSANKQQRDV
jgi:hypothetical protein